MKQLLYILLFVLLLSCNNARPVFYGPIRAQKQIDKAKAYHPGIHAQSCISTYGSPKDSIYKESVFLPGKEVRIIDTVKVYDTITQDSITYIYDNIYTRDTLATTEYVETYNPAKVAALTEQLADTKTELAKEQQTAMMYKKWAIGLGIAAVVLLVLFILRLKNILF